MKKTQVNAMPPPGFASINPQPDISPLRKIGLLAAGFALAVSSSALASIVFSDDFSSGNLNNWTAAGTWEVTTLNAQNYARGGYADNTGSITHAFSGPIAGSWTVGFNYDFEWGGGEYSGDPRLTLAVDMLDSADNGYRVQVREGSWGDYATYPSLQIYSVYGGTASSTPLANGEGFDIGGWKSLNASSPVWKNVSFTWNSLTGQLTANTDSWYGTGCNATDGSYGTFTKIRVVGTVLGGEGIDLDNINVSVVPEPTALALLGCGLLVLRRRKK